MRDPHVVRVRFEVTTGPGLSYNNPAPLTFSNALGTFRLADGVLVIEPREHFADEHTARAAIEEFLRAWEIEADLLKTLGAIRFFVSSTPGLTWWIAILLKPARR